MSAGVALRAWMETCQGPWLFIGARGSMIDRHNYLSRVLKPAAKRAGVDGVNFQKQYHQAIPESVKAASKASA